VTPFPAAPINHPPAYLMVGHLTNNSCKASDTSAESILQRLKTSVNQCPIR